MPLFNPPIAPWIISNDAASLTGVSTAAIAATGVYLYAFEVSATVIITGGKWRIGATVTGTNSTTDIGVYDSLGNLLGHTGAIINVASTNMSASFLSNVTLPPGMYFMAITSQNGGDFYLAVGSSATLTTTSRNRIASNSSAAGVLPATTGGYSDTPSKVPAMALTISGGLT